MAEGAKSIEEAEMSRKTLKYMDEMTYPSISYKLADELDQMVDQEVRVTVPGHYQRGGQPCPYDRVLATKCGAFAAEMIINKEFGYMAGVSGSKMIKVPSKR